MKSIRRMGREGSGAGDFAFRGYNLAVERIMSWSR